MSVSHPIGVFDSGYGGLTVLKELVKVLPQYDYLYLGDNARAPYGVRSYETVYEYTLECVQWLFGQGCELVVLACNTASAKALRTIQQKDLVKLDSKLRVLGVIRPSSEVIGEYTKTGHIGVLGTNGTINSDSYKIEIGKFFPNVKITQEACPLWVPLVENDEYNKPGADYFVKQHIDSVLAKDPLIDTLLLACTHYPLLLDKINKYIPDGIQVLQQGEIVSLSLKDYLIRHKELETCISKNNHRLFYTTDSAADFNAHASRFFGETVEALKLDLLHTKS
jgi:glutamate racemase